MSIGFGHEGGGCFDSTFVDISPHVTKNVSKHPRQLISPVKTCLVERTLQARDRPGISCQPADGNRTCLAREKKKVC